MSSYAVLWSEPWRDIQPGRRIIPDLAAVTSEGLESSLPAQVTFVDVVGKHRSERSYTGEGDTWALAARSRKRITCIERPPSRGESCVSERYERKLAKARKETVVSDSENELSLRRIGQRIKVVERKKTGRASRGKLASSTINVIENAAIGR